MNDLVELFGWAFVTLAIAFLLAGASFVGLAWLLSAMFG